VIFIATVSVTVPSMLFGCQFVAALRSSLPGPQPVSDGHGATVCMKPGMQRVVRGVFEVAVIPSSSSRFAVSDRQHSGVHPRELARVT
jgi:hypothetical protein